MKKALTDWFDVPRQSLDLRWTFEQAEDPSLDFLRDYSPIAYVHGFTIELSSQ
jgi:hypothetical protein